MKKLNSIGESLVNKVRNKFSIEKIVKRNQLQAIFNKIIIIAITVFILSTIITYETLKYSNNNQNEVYEEGYLASSYANKINEDILNIKIASIAYSKSYDEDIAENLRVYGNDIENNINKYKLLNNLSEEEKKIINQFIESNTIYSNKVKKMIDDIDKSKAFSDIDKSQIVKDEEVKEIISFGDTRIELSKNLISYANNHVEMLNRQSKNVKTMVMYIVIIINLVMISLFLLMMFIVTKVCEKAEQYAFYSFVTGLPNKEFAIKTVAKDISRFYTDRFTILISMDIDNFKAVNDTLGHDLGDRLLRQVGKRLKRAIHMDDQVYHMGGDEFLFLINSSYNRKQAEIMIKKYKMFLKSLFILKERQLTMLLQVWV